MRDWPGIERDAAATANGADYALNVSLGLFGECQRRGGIEKFTAQGGTGIAHFRHPVTGLWALFATTTGTIVAIAAA